MFALDVSENRIRILELSKKHNQIFVNGFGEQEFTSKDELARLLPELVTHTKPHAIRSREVGLAIPEEENFTKIVKVTQREPEDMRAFLKDEIEKILPYSQKDVYWDWKVVGNVLTQEGHLDVIFVASPKTIIDSYIQSIEQAGFEPLLIETEPNALLWGALNPFRREEALPPTLVVDIGISKVTSVIFANGAIRFTSSIKIDMVATTPPDYLAMEWGEWVKKRKEDWLLTEKSLKELCTKLNEYIDYYHEHLIHSHEKNGNELKNIIICGAWANFPELIAFMEKTLKKAVRGPEKLFSLHPAYTTALGIALRGIYEEHYAES